MGARRARLGGRQGCLSEARRYAIIYRACGACLHLRNSCTAPGSSSLGHLSSCPRDDHQCVFRSGGGPLSLDRTRTRNSSIPAGLDPVRLRRRGTRNCDFPKHCALPAVALGCRFGDVKSRVHAGGRGRGYANCSGILCIRISRVSREDAGAGMGIMSRRRRSWLWFVGLYLASIATHAVVSISIRSVLQLASR
jgi:hypothetical protein